MRACPAPRPAAAPLPALWNSSPLESERCCLLCCWGQRCCAPASAQSAPAQPAAAQPAPVQTAPTTPAKTTATPTTATPEARAAAPFTLSDALAGLSTSAQYRQAQLALKYRPGAASGSAGEFRPDGGRERQPEPGQRQHHRHRRHDHQQYLPGHDRAGASVSLPVLPWSAANLAAQSAARAYAVARATFAQTSAALTASTELAFGRAVTAQLNLSIAQSSLVASAAAAGAAPGVSGRRKCHLAQSVQSAQAAVQDAQTALLRAQAELDSARRALGTLTGRTI